MSGEGAEVLYASVAVPIPVRRQFTYRVGAGVRHAVVVGARVRVPLGRRRVVGTVVEWPASEPAEGVAVREIEAVVESEPPVAQALLELTRFAADYYLCSWGEAIDAAIPPAPRRAGAPRLLRRAAGADAAAIPARATARRKAFLALPEDSTPIPAARLGEDRKSVV